LFTKVGSGSVSEMPTFRPSGAQIAFVNPVRRSCSDQAIVFGVTADPIPHDAAFLHDRQCAVAETDAAE
ncbi:MAG TPA: hypothetical protein VEK84_14830, partial [Terriglobales bacterium]|nr:hypothetical protein [Terriglobales bacterium]